MDIPEAAGLSGPGCCPRIPTGWASGYQVAKKIPGRGLVQSNEKPWGVWRPAEVEKAHRHGPRRQEQGRSRMRPQFLPLMTWSLKTEFLRRSQLVGEMIQPNVPMPHQPVALNGVISIGQRSKSHFTDRGTWSAAQRSLKFPQGSTCAGGLIPWPPQSQS